MLRIIFGKSGNLVDRTQDLISQVELKEQTVQERIRKLFNKKITNVNLKDRFLKSTQ
jgi:hypothetical protein